MFCSNKTDATFALQRRARAFTLMEVCLAMGILVLLAGALYAMVDGTLRATSILETTGERNRQITGFAELCRRTFHSIPPTSAFQTHMVKQGTGYAAELVFKNSSGLFAWRDTGSTETSSILGVREQVGGLLSLSLLQDADEKISDYLANSSADRQWLALLTDLQKVEWRFFDPRTRVWAKEWNEPNFRPSLVEMTLTIEKEPLRYVFWLPPVGQQQQQPSP
jgi:hypothetical protein